MTGCTHALAQLIEVLACGEDSATRTFENLAQRCRPAALYPVLLGIAADEARHQRWLTRLQPFLPVLTPDVTFERRLRRFFCRLEHEDLPIHFARIFALDSAVCQLLATVQTRCTELRIPAPVGAVLGRIRRDEARHVRVAKQCAEPFLGTSRGRDLIAQVREDLVQVLAYRADALESLNVDPDRLFSRLRRVPRCAATP